MTSPRYLTRFEFDLLRAALPLMELLCRGCSVVLPQKPDPTEWEFGVDWRHLQCDAALDWEETPASKEERASPPDRLRRDGRMTGTRNTAAGFNPSPEQVDQRKLCTPRERCGFDFSVEENPNFDKSWVMSHCTEHEAVGEEESCAGCEGFGMDCWSVWVES